jgi:serine/threonine-protein kinase
MVGGKYRVGRTIGRGGMGVIVEATHVELGTTVAIKVLKADYTEKPEVAERFLREARAAAQLKGEHICRVHDFGRLEDGAPYMVMELLEGRDLGTLVDLHGPLPVPLVAHYVVQTCEGIAEPHARGLVHRDLKPGNLFLERKLDGTPWIKILDFGIAKNAQSDFKLTETKSVVGSPSYMAPEQLRSSKLVDTRTDIWALGIVLFELLTEKLPFAGDSLPELVHAITQVAPPALPESVPSEFAAIVMRCLEKDPEARYQDVALLSADLEPYAKLAPKQLAESTTAMLSKQPGTATKASFVVDELLALKKTTLGSSTGALIGKKSLPRATLGLVAALIVAVGVIVFLATRGGGESPAPTKDESAAMPVNPPPLPPAPDAAPVTVVAPPDAAQVESIPVDAAVETAVTPPPEAATTATTTKKKPGTKKHPPHPNPNPNPNPNPSKPPTDLTKSRF